MLNRVFTPVVAIMTASVFQACSLHSVNEEPSPLVSSDGSFSTTLDEKRSDLRVIGSEDSWWTSFNDEKLDSLIELAFVNNFSLKQAVSRILQSKSLYTQATSTLLPQLSLDASTRQDWEDFSELDATTDAGGALRWEVDFFGKLQSIRTAKEFEQKASESDYIALRLSLSSEVATTYFRAVEAEQQLELLQWQIATAEELLSITELRFKSGLASSVDFHQQKSLLLRTQSLIPQVEQNLLALENRLDILTGSVPDGKKVTSISDTLPKDLPFLLRPLHADLLLNRPDLKALQYGLVAADADVARAVAERLPQVTLAASVGYTDGENFSGPGAAIFGDLIMPLIDWGARRAEVRRTEAVYNERQALYTERFLVAIAEVENALFNVKSQSQLVEKLTELEDSLERTVEETRARYTQGLTDYLPVLSAVQDLQEIERTLLAERRRLMTFTVDLIKALGGSAKQLH